MATKLQVDVNYFVITEASGKVSAFPKKSIYYEMAKEVLHFFVGKQQVADAYPIGLTGTVTLNTGASGSVDGIRVNGVEIMSGAKGTAQCTSVIAGDTVTVNGLVYTAVAGAKADYTEFSIDVDDNSTASDLADSITKDTRVGTLNDVTAVATTDTVTMTQTVGGAGGKATTLAESTSGARITISGATFGAPVVYDTSLTQTAANVAANITAYSSNYSATNVAGLIVIKNKKPGLEVNGFVVASETTTITKTDANMGVETGNLVDSAGNEFTGVTNLLTFLRTNTGN